MTVWHGVGAGPLRQYVEFQGECLRFACDVSEFVG